VTDADWILTKNEIMRKVKRLFETLQNRQREWIMHHSNQLPGPAISIPPKISRGENYRGLPYMMLDHPRVFEKEHILALRTLFWWGNFFSITLHLSGRYKKDFGEQVLQNARDRDNDPLFACIHDEQWEHHFEPGNYRRCRDLDSGDVEHIRSRHFMKLARKMPLTDWDRASEKLFGDFVELLGLIQLPSR